MGGGGFGGGGSSSFSRGDGTQWKGDAEDWIPVGLVVTMLGGFVAAGIFLNPEAKRVRLVEMVFVLPACRYLPLLDDVMREAEFATPTGRQRVLRRLCQALASGELLEGFVAPQGKYWSGVDLLHVAEARYRERMRQADLQEADPVQVAQARRRDGPAPEEAVCILGVLAAAPVRMCGSAADAKGARALLERLGRMPLYDDVHPAVLYLYYAPDPGRHLSLEEAQRLVAALKEAPEERMGDGMTALARAAFSGNAEVVRRLLTRGADVNARGRKGGTALMMAAHLGHADVVRLLLERGADVKARTQDGKTALQMAEQGGHTAVADALRRAGAKKEEPDSWRKENNATEQRPTL